MPKILINEVDKTSPGTPSSYANFSVLIPGFQKEFDESTKETAEEELEKIAEKEAEIAEANADVKKAKLKELADLEENLSAEAKVIRARKKSADVNGVFEFNSAADFESIIGLCAPKTSLEIPDGSENPNLYTNYHYGNQMAYELLKLGYTVIYKPIAPEKITDIGNDSFWNVFRDKASYDFRFIAHGLLNTTTGLDSVTNDLNAAETRYEAVKEAIKQLEAINAKVDKKITDKEIEEDQRADELQAEYELIKNAYDGFYVYDTETGVSEKERYDAFASYTTEEGDATITGAFDGTRNEQTNLEYEISLLQNTLKKVQIVDESTINTANGIIANLAKFNSNDTDDIPGRGDCVALIELAEECYVNTASTRPEGQIVDAINKLSDINVNNGKYCALTVPSLVYKMSDNANFGNNKKFPGAFHYLACFINSLGSGFAEWYAAAGYTRGVASLVVDYTTVKLGEVAINVLEPRYIENQETNPKFACNVIANFRGSYYLWGNRTAHELGSKYAGEDLVASHFLNIRQLCITIKKQLYVACRRFTFDPNSDTLWFNFVNAIRPTLELMKADQGIRDYRITKVFTDKKATLKAKIRIIPIEAIEDFDLEVSLEDSFGETAATITE